MSGAVRRPVRRALVVVNPKAQAVTRARRNAILEPLARAFHLDVRFTKGRGHPSELAADGAWAIGWKTAETTYV